MNRVMKLPERPELFVIFKLLCPKHIFQKKCFTAYFS